MATFVLSQAHAKYAATSVNMEVSSPKFDKRVAVLSYRLRSEAHLQEKDALKFATHLAHASIASVKDAIVSHSHFPHGFS